MSWLKRLSCLTVWRGNSGRSARQEGLPVGPFTLPSTRYSSADAYSLELASTVHYKRGTLDLQLGPKPYSIIRHENTSSHICYHIGQASSHDRKS
jgi:hypothetical protein